MVTLGKQLRARAQALDLTDAEVARRAGLAARRYGHYVSGYREPDLQTLTRICTVLATTPNHLLGFLEEAPQRFGFAEDAPVRTAGPKPRRACWRWSISPCLPSAASMAIMV